MLKSRQRIAIMFASCFMLIGLLSSAQFVAARSYIHLPVLMYHYVSVPPADVDPRLRDLWVSPDHFRCQMRWLKEQGFHTISSEELIAALKHDQPLPSNPIMLTFDDGLADGYYSVLPTLREFGFKGTFFVVTHWIDDGNASSLSWQEIQAMSDADMAIESHSYDHDDLRRHSPNWLATEINHSLNDIQSHTGIRPRAFAYPLGRYDSALIRALLHTGVEAGFTTNDGLGVWRAHLMQIPRIRIRSTTTLKEFAWLVSRTSQLSTPTPASSTPSPTGSCQGE